jgi:hypothetical protein
MDIEQLCIDLQITEHIQALSEWRDSLIRKTAEDLQKKDDRINELETLKSTMESKVSSALESGNPQEFIAVATEFCNPVAAKRKQLEDSIASAQAELDSLQ